MQAELGERLEPIEAELAKQRQKEHGGTAPGRKNTGGHLNTSDSDTGKARDLIARKVGLSPTTYQRAKTIIQKKIK